LAAVPAPRAEVCAEVDPQGRFVRMMILSRASVDDVAIWTVTRQVPGQVPLNPLGDFNRDLWPVFVQDPNDGYRPWVVWSRFNGSAYDLAWSRWDDHGWQDIAWLQDRPTVGNDVDPELDLDEDGRPYVSWWTDEGGLGKVYFSLYLDTRWMARYQISTDGVDSRYPVMTINEDGSVTIVYETPTGSEARTVVFVEDVSITDDADPIGTLTIENFGR
jgi:hypothetical protein